MGMVAPQQRIASAYTVIFGCYGDVSRYAQERGVCRQWVYRESAWLLTTLTGTAQQQEVDALRQQVRELTARTAELDRRLTQAVVLDRDKQQEFASVAQAVGVSLPATRELLAVLLPATAPSVAQLGRWTKAAGERAGELLAVLDECSRAQVQQVAADEIYVNDPVLMVVEPESLCWLSGRLTEQVNGVAWAQEFRQLPALEQVTRDGGSGLRKGVATVNQERQEQGLPPVADQLDHFHSLREGGRGLRKLEARAQHAWAAAEQAQQELDRQRRQGQSLQGKTAPVHRAWQQAEAAMDAWQDGERAWQQTQQAVQLFTPEGELNSRARAEAVLAETLPQLPDADFAKAKRLLHKPETLTFLDAVHQKLEAMPVPAEAREAALCQEGLRRHPELLQGDAPSAAAMRGVLLACAVVLAKAGDAGPQAVQGVRRILRNTWRASSLVEGINSVLRMQQARHRKMTQGLVDLKRLYWNCHTFRTGRRRGQTPYQRLGLPWPAGLRWSDVLKLTPEQLRYKLSTLKKAA